MKKLLIIILTALTTACGYTPPPEANLTLGSANDLVGNYELSNVVKSGAPADETCVASPFEISVINNTLNIGERNYECGMILITLSEIYGLKIVGQDLYMPDGKKRVGSIGLGGAGTMAIMASAAVTGNGCSVNFFISKVVTNGVTKYSLTDDIACLGIPSSKYTSDIAKQ